MTARLASLCAIGAAALLAGSAPAMASPPDARATLADLARAATADGVPQAAEGRMPAPSGTRGPRAVTASGAFYDAFGDNEVLAPDLQRMVPLTSDDGRYTVGITLDTNGLIPGDLVASFVDTDGNALTGSPAFDGADVAVSIVGQYGVDSVSAGRWDGSSFATAHFPSLMSFTSGATDEVWSISAAELGVVPGARTTLSFGTIYSGIYDDYFDFAPEAGQAPFAFTAGSLTPPPPPAPPPPRVGSPPTFSAPIPPRLAVRGFTLSPRLGGVRVRLGWAHGAGGVRWQVTLAGRVGGVRRTKTVAGTGSAGTRTVERAVGLPGSWRGARVSAQLVVWNDGRAMLRRGSAVVPR